MGTPMTTKSSGICIAFPDICMTPVPLVGNVPIPYVNIGQLSDVKDTSTNVKAGGKEVVVIESSIETTSGDEAGVNNGVVSGEITGELKFTSASSTVRVNGKGVVRMFDTTTQNNMNAVGIVLGGIPSVLVGG